ncbi:MAG: hypothetical protein NT002_13345 [candidate division Zixibacteria bacterium]|nr:hypothetical protein [candidate division Zixibacteria bacterium]
MPMAKPALILWKDRKKRSIDNYWWLANLAGLTCQYPELLYSGKRVSRPPAAGGFRPILNDPLRTRRPGYTNHMAFEGHNRKGISPFAICGTSSDDSILLRYNHLHNAGGQNIRKIRECKTIISYTDL